MSEKTDDKANEKADEKNQKNGGGGNGLRRIHSVIFSKFGRGARVALIVLLLVAWGRRLCLGCRQKIRQ